MQENFNLDPEATARFQEVSSESRATHMIIKLPEHLAKCEDQMKSCFPACRLGKAKRPHQVRVLPATHREGFQGAESTVTGCIGILQCHR